MSITAHQNLEPIANALELPGIFVTGTDTEIGKTIVSCQILRHWQSMGHDALGVKPIATGCENQKGRWINEDALLMGEASTDEAKSFLETLGEKPGDPLEGYLRPLSPLSAARLENRNFDFQEIDARVRKISDACLEKNIHLLVEGLGGSMVPLGQEYFVADWISDLAMKAVVVCRTELGTISHTMLTIESLQKRGVETAAIVASRQQSGNLTETEKSSVAEIREQNPQTPVMVLDYLK